MRTWLLPGAWALLSLMSVVTLRSVAPGVAAQQLVYVLLAGALFWLVARIKFQAFVQSSWISYALLCVLLVIPLLIGKTTRGIAAWIDIGTLFSIQPSQLAVPIVGLVIASFIAHHDLRDWKRLGQAVGVIGLPALLIALEPDLGTLIVFLASVGVLIFLSKIPWWFIGSSVITLIGVAWLSWLWLLEPYQQQRITSFLSADYDLQGAGYNARQALIAVGSGQWWGRGLGQGVQSHLRFLPERQTDFIFASLAEEWGFSGASMVLMLYSLIIAVCLWQAHRGITPESRYYSWVVAVMMVVQIFINIGMNMNLMPITGITLPLLSYGGSSVLSVTFMLAILQSSLRDQAYSTPRRHFS